MSSQLQPSCSQGACMYDMCNTRQRYCRPALALHINAVVSHTDILYMLCCRACGQPATAVMAQKFCMFGLMSLAPATMGRRSHTAALLRGGPGLAWWAAKSLGTPMFLQTSGAMLLRYALSVLAASNGSTLYNACVSAPSPPILAARASQQSVWLFVCPVRVCPDCQSKPHCADHVYARCLSAPEMVQDQSAGVGILHKLQCCMPLELPILSMFWLSGSSGPLFERQVTCFAHHSARSQHRSRRNSPFYPAHSSRCCLLLNMHTFLGIQAFVMM